MMKTLLRFLPIIIHLNKTTKGLISPFVVLFTFVVNSKMYKQRLLLPVNYNKHFPEAWHSTLYRRLRC